MVRVVLPVQSAVETVAGLGGPGQPTIVVRSYSRDGQGYDLTPYVEGLSWSSVNPGGDETCTFALARQWFSGAPEVRKGNRLEIHSGPDVLWRGRVEENEGTVEASEMIGVVAYGSGIVLRDSRMREIYCDSELQAWLNQPSLTRQIELTPNPASGGITYDTNSSSHEVARDDLGTPAVVQSQSRVNADGPGSPGKRTLAETWYDAAEIPIDAVYHDTTTSGRDAENGGPLTAAGGWIVRLTLADDDALAAGFEQRDCLATTTGHFTASEDSRKFAMVQMFFDGTNTTDGLWKTLWKKLRVYGRHGLARQGSDPGGFYASQIVADIIGRVSGIRVRRIDQSTYLLSHSTFKEPTPHEEAVKETSRYEAVDWGTWGPDSVLERSEGNFDWKAREPSVAHWIAHRQDCESVRLSTELASLHNAVDVHFVDPSGAARVVTRTTTVPELDEADPPITHTGRVDGGTLTTAGAEQLGDAFLALSGQHAPARGNVVVAQPIRHHSRGLLPPHYMRADGSNLKVPDVLPSREMFALSQDPDRRTLLPIQRVSIDASGPVPKASIEVDQSLDLLSILQARMGQEASLVG